jgi:hypothetical protein
MALQFSTTLRNGMCSEFPTILGGSEKIKVFSGGVPTNCAAADTGTLIVEFDLASSGDWGSPSSGAISLAGLTLSATAVASLTAGYFRMYDSSAGCHVQGTVTATGGGGDMQMNSTSITSGQTVNLTGFTLTAPGA